MHHKKLLSLISALFFFYGQSQVIINNLDNPYSQDFNSLAKTGTSSTLPTGWSFVESGTGQNTTYTAGTGSSNTGDTYSYGASNNAERAFGCLQTGSLVPTIGVKFQNNSGTAITSIIVNYTGEQWRLGTADINNDKLDFQYSTDATSLTTGTYIDVNILDFTSPLVGEQQSAGTKDGNVNANRKVIPAFKITGLNIPNGGTFWLRWQDLNISGSEDGLAIDDFTLSFKQPLVACTHLAAIPPNLMLNTTSISEVSGSFMAPNPAGDRYLVVRSLNSSLGASPVNGIFYNPGDKIGSGTVVSFEPATNFTAKGLLYSTKYYFFVFPMKHECYSIFYSTSPLKGNITTKDYYEPANGLTCQPLKTKLKEIISGNTEVFTYDDIWNLYQYSDLHKNDQNTQDIIWDMYSDNPNGPEPYTFTYGDPDEVDGGGQCNPNYMVEGDCYNREHACPQSWFGGQVLPMRTDVHHVFPTDGYVNTMHSNNPFGEVINVTKTSLAGSKVGTGNNFGYIGKVFEPIDEYKGDLARALLYMAVRYEDQIITNNWSWNSNANEVFLNGPGNAEFPVVDEPDVAMRRLQIYDDWHLQTLIKWHNGDPVSQKEKDRNNVIYTQSVNGKIQGNRNPFIDHPEFVEKIWTCTGLDIDNLFGGGNEENFLKSEAKNSQSVMTVYPNPAVGVTEVTVRLSQPLSANSEIKVMDLTGMVKINQNISAGQELIRLNVQPLFVGRYFIQIIDNGRPINQYLIISK